jgi:hypothetical protein
VYAIFPSHKIKSTQFEVSHREMMILFPHVRFQHYFKKANKLAVALARQWTYLQQDFIVFENPLLIFFCFWKFDIIRGMYYDRYCSSSLTVVSFIASPFQPPKKMTIKEKKKKKKKKDL